MWAMTRPRSRPGPRGSFANQLRAARDALGLTQEAAADALSIARTTIARWETGSMTPRGLARRFVDAWIARALKSQKE